MSKQFVTLNEHEFINWANNTFENNYQMTKPKNGRELVIVNDLKIHGLEIHIYTSVEPGSNVTRNKSEDAIRIILYDRFAGKMVYQESKILRVEGDTTVFERLTERCKNVLNIVETMQQKDLFCQCPKDRAHAVKRTNSKTGETFYGCSLFPLCRDKGFNKINHAKNKYPLDLNPFGMIAPVIKPAVTLDAVIVPRTEPSKSTKEFKRWEVDEAMEPVSTEQWTLTQYPFKTFNFVQSTVYNSNVWNRDVNLILGTATSSGKTICAEMVMAQILYKDS